MNRFMLKEWEKFISIFLPQESELKQEAEFKEENIKISSNKETEINKEEDASISSTQELEIKQKAESKQQEQDYFIVPDLLKKDEQLRACIFVSRDLLAKVFLYLSEKELMEFSVVSKEFYQSSADAFDLKYKGDKAELLNILQFKLNGKISPVETEHLLLLYKKIAEGTIWSHKTFNKLKKKAMQELISLGYPMEVITAIKPEILWALPEIDIPNTRPDYLNYFKPDEVPDGMSRGVDHDWGRPAIFFKFKITFDNGRDESFDKLNSLTVHHRRYRGRDKDNNRWVSARSKYTREEFIIDHIENRVFGKEIPNYGTSPTFRPMLTAYQRSIITGKQMEPVLVELKPDYYLTMKYKTNVSLQLSELKDIPFQKLA